MPLTQPIRSAAQRSRRGVALWLFVCCGFVFAMVVLGGVTRLSGAGLSMVDWKPLSGILPPLDVVEWDAQFQRYQQSPQYRQSNFGMSVDEFKRIFWLEYLHRLLGRGVGLVFALPFVFFFLTGRLQQGLAPKLIVLFILGGVQGLVGWYMVKSGLVNEPHVSPYRLTLHLTLALLIYMYMLWVALDLWSARLPSNIRAPLHHPLRWLLALLILTIVSGGFMAGNRAGFAFNTFPKMGTEWVPNAMYIMQPWYRNLFENIVTVHFNHRLLAMLLFVSVLIVRFNRGALDLTRGSRRWMSTMLVVVSVQITLGILTLLFYVPVPLAAFHQAGAIALLTIVLCLLHSVRLPAR